MEFLGRHYLVYQQPLEIPIFIMLGLLPLGAVGIVMSALALLRGRTPPLQTQAFALAGCAAICGSAVNDLILKPLFGRIGVNEFFFQPRRYGFALLSGDFDSAFPSGHAVIAVAFLMVLALLYPRWRFFHAGLLTAVLVSLLISRWHFPADLAAGAFVGATAAFVTLATARRFTRPGF